MEYSFSFRERNGSICLVLSYKIGNRWKQKTKQGFKTQREAKKHQDELLRLARKEVGFDLDPTLRGITLRKFWAIYERDKSQELTFSTLWTYKAGLENFTSILDIPLVKLSTAAIVNAFQQIGLSTATKNLSLAALKTILEHAVKIYKIIPSNPARPVSRIRFKEKKPLRALSRKELHQLIERVKDYRADVYLLILIAATTGMRCGEALGLTWDNIDFNKQTITINKQWGSVAHGLQGFKPCKTRNSYRTLPVSASLLHELKVWHDFRPLPLDGRVFGGLSSLYIATLAGEYIRKHFPGRTFHSLRHTFATLLLSETGDVNLVAGVLGDTIQTVSATYLDYTQDVRDRAAKTIQWLF